MNKLFDTLETYKLLFQISSKILKLKIKTIKSASMSNRESNRKKNRPES